MSKKKFFITGAAGFIGSNLCDFLLREGHEVVGWDNLSTGKKVFLKTALLNPQFTFCEGDNLDAVNLTKAMKTCNCVVHLAANADVRHGLQNTSKDLQQNTIATYTVLEAARTNGIKEFAFSSTGSVYGEAQVIPTPENAPFPIQTSLYGASKLAGEGLIQAYCEGFNMVGYIFRFVSILGERYTHGHIYDFVGQLKKNPNSLHVLGDGTQKKSYLYVHDCMAAIYHVLNSKQPNKINIFNLGTNEYCTVKESIKHICTELAVSPTIEYAGGSRGWVGDSPFIFLDTTKIRNTGWLPQVSIADGITRTVKWLCNHQEVYGK